MIGITNIFNQDAKKLLSVIGTDEISATIWRATSLDTGDTFFLALLRRQNWYPHDSESYKGETHPAGIYRTKDAATDELLRLWHFIGDQEQTDPKNFTFKHDTEPISPLEIVNLRTPFI